VRQSRQCRVIVTTAALAVLFILPIWPIHHEIIAVKQKELDRINALLCKARKRVCQRA
jgi:hypothetical protein